MSAGSKRKQPSESKVYAVRAGFNPGIYSSWAECFAQVKGFKGAIFQSFSSVVDAEAFLNNKRISYANDSSRPGGTRFYGVQRGHKIGVYTDWPSAQEQISRFQKPKFKRFATYAEAERFVLDGQPNSSQSSEMISNNTAIPDTIKEYLDEDKYEDLGLGPLPDDAEDGFDPTIMLNPMTGMIMRKDPEQSRALKVQAKGPSSNVPLHIYTDGSAVGNGKRGAIAGVGVYFGDGDPRNVSERLKGSRQTNQRAELTAVLRALEIAPRDRDVKIFSDSKYAISCVTEWFQNWRRNNWMTANKKPVENKDLVESVVSKIEERQRMMVKTQFQWVKGHASEVGNIRADELAVRATTNTK